MSALSEAARRRTFAIISHPDAGKSTVTEKLLLYAGAIEEAGAVKARAGRQRDITSDWMELERQRGISITSTVLQFEYRDRVINLLDTPGHRDFSEDTYRVLSAVDAAVIVLDAAKGIEDQTLKLFQVARQRRLPLITFVNKLDRPSISPLELCDEIERTLGTQPTPLTWPVGEGPDFAGVVDRASGDFWKFGRTAHGATQATEERLHLNGLAEFGSRGQAAQSELELLDAVEANHSEKSFLAGESTPVLFGSALWNFGIRLLLDTVSDIVPSPEPEPDIAGERHALTEPFAGQVFKIQANLDPRHRDRIAYLRIHRGSFERGMTLINTRTGRTLSTKYAHQVFGRDRDTLDIAFPGDVIGLVNAGDARIGDTLSLNGGVVYPPIPTFAPEHFRTARNLDTSKYKQFRRGAAQLDEEGVIQVLRHPERGDREPIFAAVGPMQYEVAAHRLREEFGARIELSPTPYSIARRTDAAGAAVLSRRRHIEIFTRSDGTPLVLFPGRHHLEAAEKDHPDVLLDSILVG